MTDILTFSVATLINQPTGTNENYLFEGPVEFEDFEVKSNIKGKVQLMRIDEGINAAILNLEVKVKFICVKCLKPISPDIKVGFFEKQFLFHRPKNVDDPNDLYLINKKNMTIDLKEALRQEIILHFPINQVCSQKCKGICPKCGKDLNKTACKCKTNAEENTGYKPLSVLKNLIK